MAVATKQSFPSAGQKYWQILPLCPTGYGDSPYQSFSTFAGNPYLIDLDTLVDQGLLRKDEIEAYCWQERENKVCYRLLYENRCKVLHKAFERFRPDEKYEAYVSQQREWLPDYALFMTLKEVYPGGDWLSWPEDLRLRREDALAQAAKTYDAEIRYQYFLPCSFS